MSLSHFLHQVARAFAVTEPAVEAPSSVPEPVGAPVLHNIGTDGLRLALSYDNGYSVGELSEYDVEDLQKSAPVVEAWYYYFPGWYCGAGSLLGRDAAGRWYETGMGHCSCNGPLEPMMWGGEPIRLPSFDSLAAVEASRSPDSLAEIAPLLAAARAAGHA